MKLLRTLAALVLFAQVAACSTTYQPKHDGRIRLVMQQGQYALAKDGTIVREDGPFATLATCDEAAKTAAYHAQTKLKSGRDLATIAAILNLFVLSVPATMPLL